MPEKIYTDKAPKPVGPYSQAVVSNGFVFVAGQIPIDPATGQLVEGDIKAQTRRVMENIKAILEAAGTSMDNVVYATAYLADLNDYKAFNEVYEQYLGQARPARVTVKAEIPKGARLEVSVIAALR